MYIEFLKNTLLKILLTVNSSFQFKVKCSIIIKNKYMQPENMLLKNTLQC